MYGCAWTSLSRVVRAAVDRLRYVWALAVATWRVVVLHRFVCQQDVWVYKVVALNEEDGTDANVTRTFVPSSWEKSVRRVTGWTTPYLRAEVRYVAHGRKFRAVLRPGDDWTPPEVPERHRGGPKGVMSAELVGNGKDVNVTARVLKYQGPCKDFHHGHGLHVGISDMFPYDDMAELRENFSELRVMDAHCRVLSIPLDCADVGAAIRGP